jgi:hypothetical protein
MFQSHSSPSVPNFLRGKAVKPYLPVSMLHDNTLVAPHDAERHIITVGDRIGRKMGDITIRTGSLRIGFTFFEKLSTYMPAMTVEEVAGILFPQGYISRDAAVEKVIREFVEKSGNGDRKRLEIIENSRPQLQMESGTPGI